MSTDVYESIRWDNIQHLIAFHCAPVLSGIKISNLVVTCESGYKDACRILGETKIEMYVLSRLKGKMVLLLFDREKLSEYLAEPKCREFLSKMGQYEQITDVDMCLKRLALKYSEYARGKAPFPHELGIVLGYPVEDVIGFMANEGQNYILSGYWKVYHKADKAKAIFRAYDDCTEAMMRALISGESLCDAVKNCSMSYV